MDRTATSVCIAIFLCHHWTSAGILEDALDSVQKSLKVNVKDQFRNDRRAEEFSFDQGNDSSHDPTSMQFKNQNFKIVLGKAGLRTLDTILDRVFNFTSELHERNEHYSFLTQNGNVFNKPDSQPSNSLHLSSPSGLQSAPPSSILSGFHSPSSSSTLSSGLLSFSPPSPNHFNFEAHIPVAFQSPSSHEFLNVLNSVPGTTDRNFGNLLRTTGKPFLAASTQMEHSVKDNASLPPVKLGSGTRRRPILTFRDAPVYYDPNEGVLKSNSLYKNKIEEDLLSDPMIAKAPSETIGITTITVPPLFIQLPEVGPPAMEGPAEVFESAPDGNEVVQFQAKHTYNSPVESLSYKPDTPALGEPTVHQEDHLVVVDVDGAPMGDRSGAGTRLAAVDLPGVGKFLIQRPQPQELFSTDQLTLLTPFVGSVLPASRPGLTSSHRPAQTVQEVTQTAGTASYEHFPVEGLKGELLGTAESNVLSLTRDDALESKGSAWLGVKSGEDEVRGIPRADALKSFSTNEEHSAFSSMLGMDPSPLPMNERMTSAPKERTPMSRVTISPPFDQTLTELIEDTNASDRIRQKNAEAFWKQNQDSTLHYSSKIISDYVSPEAQKNDSTVALPMLMRQHLRASVSELLKNNQPKSLLHKQAQEFDDFLSNNFSTFAINSPNLESIVIYAGNPNLKLTRLSPSATNENNTNEPQSNSVGNSSNSLASITNSFFNTDLPLYPPLIPFHHGIKSPGSISALTKNLSLPSHGENNSFDSPTLPETPATSNKLSISAPGMLGYGYSSPTPTASPTPSTPGSHGTTPSSRKPSTSTPNYQNPPTINGPALNQNTNSSYSSSYQSGNSGGSNSTSETMNGYNTSSNESYMGYSGLSMFPMNIVAPVMFPMNIVAPVEDTSDSQNQDDNPSSDSINSNILKISSTDRDSVMNNNATLNPLLSSYLSYNADSNSSFPNYRTSHEDLPRSKALDIAIISYLNNLNQNLLIENYLRNSNLRNQDVRFNDVAARQSINQNSRIVYPDETPIWSQQDRNLMNIISGDRLVFHDNVHPAFLPKSSATGINPWSSVHQSSSQSSFIPSQTQQSQAFTGDLWSSNRLPLNQLGSQVLPIPQQLVSNSDPFSFFNTTHGLDLPLNNSPFFPQSNQPLPIFGPDSSGRNQSPWFPNENFDHSVFRDDTPRLNAQVDNNAVFLRSVLLEDLSRRYYEGLQK